MAAPLHDTDVQSPPRPCGMLLVQFLSLNSGGPPLYFLQGDIWLPGRQSLLSVLFLGPSEVDYGESYPEGHCIFLLPTRQDLVVMWNYKAGIDIVDEKEATS